MNITANIKSNGLVIRTIECVVPELPTDHATLVALATDAYVIAAQSAMRALGNPDRKSGRVSDADIAIKMSTWKPGTRTRGPADPVKSKARLVASLSRLSAEDRAELIRELTGAAPELVKSKKRA